MTTVRVCEELFPEGFAGKPGYPMEINLKNNIDILLKNFMDDWDFTVIISGQGEVRVGKSMLASQLACYIAHAMRIKYKQNAVFSLDKSFVFDGTELIRKGHYLGTNIPYSPLVFDEAGADLEGRKIMKGSTQQVLDYFRECGQYNLFNVLVIPEFFDLPKGIALSRSIFLIDVSYSSSPEGKLRRGDFNFYSRRKKKRLYLRGKKELNYHAASYDFHGRFYKFFPMDELKYRELKQQALLKRQDNKVDKKQKRGDIALYILNKDFKMVHTKISERFDDFDCSMPLSTLSECINRVSPRESSKSPPSGTI